jgi:hemoglobin-like flavoprotein
MTVILEYEAAVRESWILVHDQGAVLTARFYENLFALDPALRALFTRFDEATRSRKLLAALDEMVLLLDAPDRLVSAIIPLGRRHGEYGVTDRDYHTGATAFLLAMHDVLGERFTVDADRGWREVYALVSEVMRRAGHGVTRVASSDT